MATQTTTISKRKPVEIAEAAVKTGPAAAAMVAGGVGAFVIGLMTTLVEASAPLGNSLKWVNPVGPLSGKVGVALVAWLVSWLLLNLGLKNKNTSLTKAFTITMVLIVGGLLLTFPPFFDLFAPK